MAGIVADLETLSTALRHFEAERFEEAKAVCLEILRQTPEDFWTLRLLGDVYAKQNEPAQAEHYLNAALAVGAPDDVAAASAMADLAVAYSNRREFATALKWAELAVARKPDDVGARHVYAISLGGMNRHTEALEHYRIARAIDPDSPELEFNEGFARMALGDWPAGWVQYESRLLMPSLFHPDPFSTSLPRWDGSVDIRGKTILVQAEQGFGDTLQFVRYAPLLSQRGARVVVRVPPQLRPLLLRLPGADEVVTFHDTPDGLDMQCLVMSLPALLGTTLDNVPNAVPYIHVPPEYLQLWRSLLGPRKRIRIGIVWSGRQNIPLRSIPVATLEPLLARPDLEFHALQTEIPDADRAWLAEHPFIVDHNVSFVDTAAIASCMDLIITIDTSIAHLVGALALPTWILLPFAADSRWLVGRSDTPWYPTARLFRQTRPNDWDGVVAEVLQALG